MYRRAPIQIRHLVRSLFLSESRWKDYFLVERKVGGVVAQSGNMVAGRLSAIARSCRPGRRRAIVEE